MKRALLTFLACLIAAEARAQEPEPAPPPDEAPIPIPAIDDPMLAPVAPPKNLLTTFEQAQQLLESKNLELALARAEIERARGVWRQALSGTLPSVTGTASITARLVQPSDIIGNRFDYTYQAQIVGVQPLLDVAAWHAIGTADVAEERAKVSAEEQRRQVYGGVAEAVLAVVVTERAAELHRAGLRAALAVEAIWTKREELGGGHKLDLARFAQDVAAARLAVIEGNESVRRAREALGLALGTSEPWGVSPEVSVDEVEDSLRKSCRGVDTLAERSDIATAQLDLKIAERDVKQVELGFVPTVDLVTTLGVAPGFREIKPQPSVTIGGVLTWSIWDGGFRYGSLRTARSQVDAARARLEFEERDATTEQSRALRQVEVSENALRTTSQGRDVAREANRLTIVAFRAGSGSSLDLVLAAQALRRAEIETALREFELARAEIEALLVASRCAP